MAKAEVIVWSLCLFMYILICMGLKILPLDFCSWCICLGGGPHVGKGCWLLCLEIWFDISVKSSFNNQILVLVGISLCLTDWFYCQILVVHGFSVRVDNVPRHHWLPLSAYRGGDGTPESMAFSHILPLSLLQAFSTFFSLLYMEPQQTQGLPDLAQFTCFSFHSHISYYQCC